MWFRVEMVSRQVYWNKGIQWNLLTWPWLLQRLRCICNELHKRCMPMQFGLLSQGRLRLQACILLYVDHVGAANIHQPCLVKINRTKINGSLIVCVCVCCLALKIGFSFPLASEIPCFSSEWKLSADCCLRPPSPANAVDKSYLLLAENDECALDSDCKIDGATCQNARCKIATVKTKFERMKNNERNSRSTYVLDVNCDSDEDCGDVNNSVCSPLTKKCICKRGYFYDSTGCIGGKKLSILNNQ